MTNRSIRLIVLIVLIVAVIIGIWLSGGFRPDSLEGIRG